MDAPAANPQVKYPSGDVGRRLRTDATCLADGCSYKDHLHRQRASLAAIALDVDAVLRGPTMGVAQLPQSDEQPPTGSQSGSRSSAVERIRADGQGSDHAVELRRCTSVHLTGRLLAALLIRGFGVRSPGGPPAVAFGILPFRYLSALGLVPARWPRQPHRAFRLELQRLRRVRA